MAPKPVPGKKGQADQEDFSDVPTLPPLNSYIFTILCNSFFSQETREKLYKYLQDHLPQERVKTLTRDEIITYGKAKQTILEPNVAATLPHDDPRLKMSESEQIAKSAVDKLFEMSVIARRLKKEKIQKLEEEAKAQQQVDPKYQPQSQDSDHLDVMFQIIDYPNTKAEALAFAKFNHNIHCIYEINQALKISEAPEEEEELQGQEQFQYQESENSYQQKTQAKLNQLLEARAASSQNSSLRNMAVIKLDFFNCPEIEYKINEQGEEYENRKEAEVIFTHDFNTKLDHMGALYIKYLRFREKVSLLPLAPDKEAIDMINRLHLIDEDYKLWLQEVEHMDTIDQSQKDHMDQTQIEEYQREKEYRKKEIEEQKVSKAQEQEQRQKQVQELKEKLKDSVDDKFYVENYSLDNYKTSFVGHKECQNTISSIMSAMVSQIATENDYQSVYMKNLSTVSTEPETIEDLFNKCNEQINYDVKFYERQYEDESRIHDNTAQRQRRKGTEAFASQNTINGDVDYFEQQDLAKKVLLKLPKEVTSTDEDLAENACLRYKESLENLVLPSLNRHMMPPVPTKSQRIRDCEKPQLYPFCTLPVEDVERGLILKAFQELIRANLIDEGSSPERKLDKYKVFERMYQSHLTPQILRQELAEAYLTDPDIATLYYPRDDALLLAIYNKIKSGDRNEVDGEKQWRAAYRVMPDFDNWIKYFSEELVIPSQQSHDAKNATQTLKYQMDEEMIPDSLLDIDDQKVQNIQETTKMLYPFDGSIMKVDSYSIGGYQHKKSMVIKDNLKFGLRNTKISSEAMEEEKEYGLIKYTRIGETEFWMHFENDTKMLVEVVKTKRNPQKMIRIDPPKPTPEEIAAREEAIKQAQAAAAKNKGKGGSALANIPVIEEYKEPEPTWEPEPFDFLDNLFNDETDPVNQITTTFPNGLLIQHFGDGNVVQFNEEQLKNPKNEEADRLFLYKSSGVVIRHLKNRDAEVLFPNGVKAQFNKQDMMWVVTNNKGIRTAKKSGITWDLEPIPCAFETDAVTNAKMMIREDKVMTIKFKDGSFYCQHADGTMMKTSADNKEVRIEKDGFAPVVIKKNLDVDTFNYDPTKVTAEERCLVGQYVLKTLMPDGTVVDTYSEYYVENQYMPGIISVFRRPDFSVVTVDQNGQIKIISSNTRSSLNEKIGKQLMGNDVDYAKALFEKVYPDQYKGVYIGQLGAEAGVSSIIIRDIDKNTQYILDSNLELSKKVIDESLEIYLEPQVNSQSQFDGIEIEDVGGYKDPTYKNFIYPRLFVIKADGSGYELLAKEQLDYYFRIMKNSKESLKQRKIVMIGNTSAKSHYFVTKVKNLAEKELEMTCLKTLEFPGNSLYALLHNKESNKTKANMEETHSMADQYLFRQIFEFQELEPFKQEAFFDDLQRFKQWKISQVRYDSEFGIVHIPAKDQVLDIKKIEDDEYFSKRIITKILKERRNKRKEFNPEEFKKAFVKEMAHNEEVHEYQRRFTHNYDKIDESQHRNLGNAKSDSLEFGAGGYNDRHSSKDTLLNSDKIRNIKKKQEANIQNQLQDIRRMINTPMFIPHYFQSKEGHKFIKNNPEKPPSQEMLMRMSQRINRSQGNTDKPGQSQYDGQSQRSHKDNSPLGGNEVQNQEGEDKESPIVALEPEDQMKQGSAFMGGSKKQTMEEGGPPFSLYLQEKMYIKQREQEQLLKGEEYHVVKTKDFNVYGRLRQDKPFVKSIQKSAAQSELNEKFITTECIADRRVKISSMAPRQYINAPSVEDVRKQGQHQMILSAINKKQTFAELINQANAMVTSVLHDPLKRAFNIMPSSLKYGTLQAGQYYELVLTVKNEDQIAQRLTIKPLADKRIQVNQQENDPKAPGLSKNIGAIAPGICKKVIVTIYSDEEGTIKETLQILTKTDIFKIPIEAIILSPENYQKELQEQQALNGKTLTNSRVRNKLNQSIQRGRMSAKGERPISQDGGYDEFPRGQYETTNSESKLPVIPQIDRRPFEVDPKKNLKDLLKKPE